jgi:hypothetical protein
MAHSSKAPSTTTAASPNITDFEAFLEQDVAPQQPPPNVDSLVQGKRKKLSKNDEFWEGVLASEKLRLQSVSETNLTSVDAMMVGSSSDEESGDTPLRRAANRRAKAILRSFYEPHRSSPGINKDNTDTPSKRAIKRRAKDKPDAASSGLSFPARFHTDRGVKRITDVVDVGEDEHPVSQCY